ncbi:MAG: FAD-dependent oxidoreductase [Pseudomonadota bacterium]
MKTLVIGGGLSGLAVADGLQASAQEFLLIDARDRFGGRMETACAGETRFDLGPAWFWPGQPRMASLVSRLGLTKFAQFATGELVYEDEHGHVRRGLGYSSMEGSWRIESGFTALTDAMEQRISPQSKMLNAHVKRLEFRKERCAAILGDGREVSSDQVVLAMPPRIAANIEFSPKLPASSYAYLRAVPTWMAGQAKVVAVYQSPFWRDSGLSGDAMSRRGPIVEIHDASPTTGGPYALFGFVGIAPQARLNKEALREAAVDQLVRLFGEDAAEPTALFVKDWATDPLTATPLDAAMAQAHPAYGLPSSLRGLQHGRLIFAGTEVAPHYGGYLEGALEAAEAALACLAKRKAA